MSFLVVKYLASAAVVVAVSEIAKRSDRLGALIAALPLVTLLTLCWLHLEQQGTVKENRHAWLTFWYVLPSLPMFLVFPRLNQHLGFWWALTAGAVITVLAFLAVALIARGLGTTLLGAGGD